MSGEQRHRHPERERLVELYHEHGRREPDPARLERVWERLEPRLEARSSRPVRRRARFVLAGTAAAAWAAVMIAAVFLGPPARERPVALSPTPAAETAGKAATARLARLVDRTTPLLLAVANEPGAPGPRAPARRLAERLAGESREIAHDLDRAGFEQERALTAQLEAVLRQLANADAGASGGRLVRDALAERRLLLQLALHDLRRPGGGAPGPARTPGREES
jgi:hypothetical protein